MATSFRQPKSLQEQLQKVTDRWSDEVERVGKHKEQEILEVG